MLPDRVSNPGPLTYESGALQIALCGPAKVLSGELPCPCDRSCYGRFCFYHDLIQGRQLLKLKEVMMALMPNRKPRRNQWKCFIQLMNGRLSKKVVK